MDFVPLVGTKCQVTGPELTFWRWLKGEPDYVAVKKDANVEKLTITVREPHEEPCMAKNESNPR
ncbi:hypothetical protein M378DRAFT_171184 [Amanita muscaria Koide BX008]|uniref:Uncharacterized protein n=1 Tax=Amanita muscaria (strain Koide BX008) TaxID=946122 RepID=A0A0C2W9K2_AMAMK|nr:hypothetical protein M378DRAFT_171184 [Amanita muscaria Koide BX008]